MNITPEEQRNAIATIISQGLTRPVSTGAFLWGMYRNLGLRVIFFEAASGILLSFAVAALYVLTLAVSLVWLELSGFFYTALFLFSPTLFISLTLSTEAIERIDGIYDLKMTCRYTIRQIAAFRFLCFSVIGTVFAVAGSYIVYMYADIGYLLGGLSIALCSLFLCSLLLIHVMRRWREGWYLGTAIWVGAGMVPLILFRQRWEVFLSQLPPAITLGVAAIACVLFLREIKITARKVYCYADS